MAEMENLRTEKVSQEESSKLTKKKFQDELVQLKAQMESLQSQVRSENDKTLWTAYFFWFEYRQLPGIPQAVVNSHQAAVRQLSSSHRADVKLS